MPIHGQLTALWICQIVLLSLYASMQTSAIIVRRTSSTTILSARAEPIPRPTEVQTSISDSPSVSVSLEVPLWGQCNLEPHQVCVQGARCICKDEWWSQCRVPLNGSWTPLGEDWHCTETSTSDGVSSSSLPEPNPSKTVPEGTEQGNTRSNLRASSGSQTASPLNANASLTNQSSTLRSSHSLDVNDIVQESRVAPVTEKTTSSLPELGSQSNTTHEASSSPQSFHMSSEHSLGVSDTPPSSTLPISAAAITTPLVAVGSSLQSVSSSSNLPLSAAAITTPLIAGPPRPEQSSSSSTNRFVISVAEEKSTTPSSPPASVVDGLPNYSSSSIRPNLACPSETDGEDASESGPKATDAAAIQACNPNGTAITGDFSSTTNSSSTPNVPERAKINPAKGGTYLESSATQDQQSHCLDVAAHQYQACWEILNVTGYLQDWVSFNQDVCDEKDMGFADCFLYLEVGDGTNCTSFTGRSQCPSPSTRTFASRTNGQQAYYVAFNIWNIQNWFFTYYLAVSGANGLTADNINNIARTLNLPEPKKFPILDLLAGLAFGFGLISPAGYAAVIPKLGRKTEGFAAQAPGEYLLRAVQNAPTLGRNLMATGDLGNSDVQIAQLGSSLARIVAQLQNNIQNSIILVMSNFSLFLDFVQDGFFSTQISNLNTLTQNVTLSLNTYIVSQSLQMDKVIITRAVDTDINELQLNGSATMYDTNCGHGYDEWGMCANWWYDSTNHISYGLESQKNMLNNYTDALESLFNQGITTPELLFLNSQLCADAAGSTQGNAPGTSLSTSTGIWNTECISNMKICTWETVVLDVTREYTDCDHESAFAMEGCGQGLDLQQWVVPASYIGAYLTQYLVGVVCNSWGKGMGSPNG